MGRAGSGSSSGGHSSGGGNSSGHSSGGHRVGGSSGRRAGSGQGEFNRSRSYSYGPRFYGYVGPRRYSRYGRGRGMGCGFNSVLTTVVVIVILMITIGAFSMLGSGGGVKSTVKREKLKTGNAYMNDCIIDEIGWFDNKSNTARELKSFFNKTGVQPVIYLKAYDPALTTDNEKTKWAKDYYDGSFDRQDIFLYVYFAEKDTDNDVGYMCYVNGYEAGSVMDSEAVEIFWNYLDSEWYGNKSTDDLFISVFNKTGKTIMKVSTTWADVVKWIVIAVLIIAVAVIAFRIVKTKRRIEKEKAEETAKILETPLEDLADRYSDNEEGKGE